MAGTGRWLAPDTRNGLFRTFLVVLMGVVACLVLAAALIDISLAAGSAVRVGMLGLVGVLVAMAGGVVLARRMRQPIAALEASCAALEQAVEDRTRELSATAKILRVISSSPSDVQPVLDAVADNAARLCGASDALIMGVDGDTMQRTAHVGVITSASQRRPVTRDTPTGRAILEARTIHVEDVLEEFARGEYLEARPLQQATGFRTVLVVPLVRDGRVIGALTIRRLDVRGFTPQQIALVETFADQAVIAIENVRLFKELDARNAALSEALDQQTATSEILRVISSSPTELQPVLDTVAENAARVCGATDALIVRAEGGLVRRVAHVGALAPVLPEARPISRLTISGRAMLEGRTIHLADVTEPAVIAEFPEGSPAAAGGRWRTHLTVPLMRQGEAIGAITIRRAEVRPFTDKQIALLQIFADQAVIAIENVRLFKELQARNTALGESLEQQTATAEILRVISRSPTDVQPVLDAVADNAKRICGASDALIMRADGDVLRRVAHVGAVPVSLAPVRPLNRDSVAGRAIVERRAIQVEDVGDAATAREYPESGPLNAAVGIRTVTAVPLLRDDAAIGAIVIRRTEVRPFTDKQMALLQTFADQAVIAIENVRLFNEIQQKTRELEAANRHKDEFLASMSHELRTPLNAVIGFSEVLLERMFGDVNARQEEYLHDILASGRHLLSLINDILDLAKIEAGRMELELEDFDVAQAIDNAVVLVRERATRKGLSLDTRLDRDLGPLRGDQRKIKQILLNLLSNAVKFTPEGGRIEVRAVRLNGHVEISVTDTGIGIAAEDRDVVFEEFRQVGTDYAKKHEGTGLGLTLSRKFVELHGGRIWVKSQPGEGSTFAFTLPSKP